MYIAPSTEIHILKNIPLNKSYENTVYYANADAQAQAFLKYNKFTLSNYSYQRSALGTIRVQLKYEQLYDCDYLMFKNSSFENKWFYCFITGVAYISNEVSEIYYEMDVMQTWCYDYKFQDSYVERCHAGTDRLWQNTQPEGLELGKIYYTARTQFVSLCYTGNSANPTSSRLWYCILTASQVSGQLPDGVFSNGPLPMANIYSGLTVYASLSTQAIHSLLDMFNEQGKTDAIVNFYMSPINPNTQIQALSGTGEIPKDVSIKESYSITRHIDTLGDFTPHNKKLYNYPFCRIRVTNNAGIETVMHPEYFTGDNAQFKLELTGFPQPMAKILPTNYRAGTGNDYAEVYGNFPTCAAATNTFEIWLAQNKNNYIATMNSINSSYDTNRAIAQNNYAMAQRSANASAMMSANSANTGLANANLGANTARENAQRTAVAGAVGTGVSVVGHIVGLDASGLASDAVSAIGQVANYQNTQASIDTGQAQAGLTAGTALLNAQIAQSTALKNASTSQASAALSALTAKQNATAQLVAKKEDIENMPNSARGSAMCDGLNTTDLSAGFYINLEQITGEYARIIDEYFDVYGYAQNSLFAGESLDIRNWRKRFTYLKTVGCSIHGALNSNDQMAIQSIYDNGITTWKTLEDIGNYGPDNGTTME